MIGRLRGELVEVDGSRVILDVGGVGYEVLVPISIVHQLPPTGMTTVLVIRQIFREDGVFLYGFTQSSQRRIFDLLTDVKGCGPKTALALISDVGEESVAAAIVAQDSRTLARATGVGPRLAERIILELRDKIQHEGLGAQAVVRVGSSVDPGVENEVMDALLSLGYRKQEAEQAAMSVMEEVGTVQDRIRLALRQLRK